MKQKAIDLISLKACAIKAITKNDFDRPSKINFLTNINAKVILFRTISINSWVILNMISWLNIKKFWSKIALNFLSNFHPLNLLLPDQFIDIIVRYTSSLPPGNYIFEHCTDINILDFFQYFDRIFPTFCQNETIYLYRYLYRKKDEWIKSVQ